MIKLSKCSLNDDDVHAVREAMHGEHLGMNSWTQKFEQAIENYLGTDPGTFTAVNTGTSALHTAVEAVVKSPRDEIILPNITYVATLQSVLLARATPVLADICERSLNLDPKYIEKSITENTRAIIFVHHHGNTRHRDAVYNIAMKHNLKFIDDAAQSFGTIYSNGGKIPKLCSNTIVCFSFDGIKNITCGEGGGILSYNEEVNKFGRDFRLLGVQNDTEKRYASRRSWRYNINGPAARYHMQAMNAALGLSQLKRISGFKERRDEIVKRYIDQLPREFCEVVNENDKNTFHHVLVIKAKQRDALKLHLEQNNIQTGIHYFPLSKVEGYSKTIYQSIKASEKVSETLLSLPLHVDLSNEELEKVIDTIKVFYEPSAT